MRTKNTRRAGAYQGHQLSLIKPFAKTSLNHGGELRKRRSGRRQRPLSTKESLHVVFKINKNRLRSRTLRSVQAFQLTQKIIRLYSLKFYIRVEQISIQNDHCHLLVRTTRRSHFHNFFRVTAGQMAQVFEKEGDRAVVVSTIFACHSWMEVVLNHKGLYSAQ